MSAKVKSGLKQETKAEKELRKFEDRISNSDREHLMVLSLDGDILDEAEGEVDEVSTKVSTRDMITSHNHPDIILPDGTRIQGNIFSPEDLEDMANFNEYEMRATSSARTYSVRRTDFNDSSGRWPLAKAYAKAWDKAEAKAMQVADKAVEDGKIPDTESAWLRCANLTATRYLRKWMRNNANKYGYEYEEHSRRRK